MMKNWAVKNAVSLPAQNSKICPTTLLAPFAVQLKTNFQKNKAKTLACAKVFLII
jgi:hypothetical protein